MEFIPTLALAALVLKLIDFARYARAGDMNGVVTQLATWISGVLVLLLVAKTDWAGGIEIAGFPLSKLNFWSQVFYGLSLASTASLAKDVLKSVDSNNSTVIPTLLPRGRRAEHSRDVG